MKKELLHLRSWLCRSTALVAILSCSVGMSGSAFANLITNGSFEEPTIPPVPPGGFISVCSGSSFDGWDVVGAGCVSPISGLFTSGGLTFPAQDGDFWVDMTGNVSNSATGIEQTVTTSIGTLYDLSFWVGNQVNPGGPYGTTSTIEVFVGGVSQGTFTNSGGVGTFTQNWQQFTLGFTALNTSTPIELLNKDFFDNSNGLDNIVLLPHGSPPPSVPEPGTLSLFGLGLGALGVARRRKAD